MPFFLLGLFAALAALAAVHRSATRGTHRIAMPEDQPSQPAPESRSGPAPRTAQAIPVATIPVKGRIGLSVNPFEKNFLNRDDLENKLIAFATSTVRRLNGFRWPANGRFSHPEVSYTDKDYGFSIDADITYTGSVEPDFHKVQQYVSEFMEENDQLRPRILFVQVTRG